MLSSKMLLMVIPAKGERYNVLIINSREQMFENANWHGQYLYAR